MYNSLVCILPEAACEPSCVQVGEAILSGYGMGQGANPVRCVFSSQPTTSRNSSSLGRAEYARWCCMVLALVHGKSAIHGHIVLTTTDIHTTYTHVYCINSSISLVVVSRLFEANVGGPAWPASTLFQYSWS